MTDKLKELIKNAPIKRSGVFFEFMLIPTGKRYNGTFGENGFNRCLLLGKCNVADDTWYKITDYADALWFRNIPNVNFDIPNIYNAVRFWFDTPIEIHNELNTSTISGVGERRT